MSSIFLFRLCLRLCLPFEIEAAPLDEEGGSELLFGDYQ